MRRTTIALTAFALLSVAGCRPNTGADDEDETGTEDGGDGEGAECTEQTAALAPLRRINHVQYRNTITDLFDGKITPGPSFPETSHAHGYGNDPDNNVVSQLGAERIMLAAEEVAVQITDSADELVSCGPNQTERACARDYIVVMAARAFRRPLRDGELSRLMELYDEADASASWQDSLGVVFAAVFQMPQFLYLVEEGDGDPPSPNTIQLTDFELASRLSYLFRDSIPDDPLFEAAAAGQLHTPDQLENHAWRLIYEDRVRAAAAASRFARDWLEAFPGDPSEKDADLFPGYDDALVASFDEEYARFVEHVLWDSQGTVEELFTSNETVANSLLADFYGLPGGGPSGPDDWQVVELHPQRRAGLLTRPAFLATHASGIESSVTRRGKAIRTQVLCDTIEAPPPGAMAAAMFPEGATQREISEILMGDASCGGCHALMNPIGLGLESYDAIGAHRTTIKGEAIDATGEILPWKSEVEGSFEGGVELAQLLAEQDAVRACLSRNWIMHALGRSTLSEQDACTVTALQESLGESNDEVLGLMVALTRTEAFRVRQLEVD